MFKQFGIAALRSGGGRVSVESQRAAAGALLYHFFQPDECASTDKQNIGGIDGREFLMWVLAATLRRNVGHGAFENLEQGLLHSFAAHIPGNRRVLVLLSDLVDFVYVDDPLLC